MTKNGGVIVNWIGLFTCNNPAFSNPFLNVGKNEWVILICQIIHSSVNTFNINNKTIYSK